MYTIQGKNKLDFVIQLRRCRKAETLEIVCASMEKKLEGADLLTFISAVDHRRAELVTGKYYDKIPPEVWRLVI
jgi:hemolysin expression modulating protein